MNDTHVEVNLIFGGLEAALAELPGDELNNTAADSLSAPLAAIRGWLERATPPRWTPTYWPVEPTGKREDYARHHELFEAVKRYLPPTWKVDEETHSGAWYWWRGEDCAFYATPEWEGEPGIPFAWVECDGDIQEPEQLDVELTGDVDRDALRIVLKVLNYAERGY